MLQRFPGVVTRRGRRSESGAVVVEFALVLPVLVLLLWGIFEFGQAYNAKVELTAAVREGARAAALKPSTDTDAVVKAAATSAVQDAAPGLKTSSITVALTRNCPAGNVTVTAHYPFSYSIPFFGSRSTTLKAEGVMRCAG